MGVVGVLDRYSPAVDQAISHLGFDFFVSEIGQIGKCSLSDSHDWCPFTRLLKTEVAPSSIRPLEWRARPAHPSTRSYRSRPSTLRAPCAAPVTSAQRFVGSPDLRSSSRALHCGLE